LTGVRTPIDFASLAHALLQSADTLVPLWLPGGVIRGHEYVCADLGGGAGSSCSVNLNTGQWADFSGDERGNDLISLYAAIHNLNQGQAARLLMVEMGLERSEAPRNTPAKRAVQTSASDDATQGVTPVAAERVGPPQDAAAAGKRKSMWRAVTPVPPHAPAPDFKHWERPVTSIDGTWEYRFEGELYGYVVRFRTSDGGKDVMPHTWCVDEADGRGTQRWHWKQWDEPRPLYVPATLVSADLSLPVVLVEGEKCALAGFKLLAHEFDFVSWPGGSKAWAKAAWGWLMGRTVYLWPDCDAKRERLTKTEREGGVDPDTKPLLPEHRQPGVQAMVGIGSLLAADHGCTVFMCPVPKPGAVTDGWDLADAIEQGWGPEEVRAFIRGARAFTPPQDEARAKAAKIDALAGAGTELDSAAWREKLLVTDKGSIKPCRENAVLALDGMHLPDGRWLPGAPEAQGVIAFNEFTNNVEMRRQPPWASKPGVWGEETELEMGNWLSRQLWLPPMSRQTLEEAVVMLGRRHAYHPLRKRFDALRGTWDREQRLPTWLMRVCLSGGDLPKADPLRQYLARVGTWFLMAIVKRIMQPGCKFDYMMVLEGGQGRFKSTLASILGCGHFADTGLVLGDKDSYQNLQGVLVYEWAELDALARADVRKVKSFVSSTTDRFRASFDKRPRDYPRQVVFIGTTNESHYLSDPTGNRRFWPVKVTRQIDLDWVRDNLDQMLAEALHRVDAGERMWPTPEEQRKLFDLQQGDRTVESPLESAIREYLYDEEQRVSMNGRNGALLDRITLKDLLSAVGLSLEKQTSLVTKEASAILGRLGWERATRMSTKEDIKRPWLYHRPKESAGHAGPAGDDSDNCPPQGHAAAETVDGCPF
jgi:putative DNA primase/helicase